MKKIIGFAPTWLLYYIGHLISLPMLKFDIGFLYTIYNNCMTTSEDIQKWSGLKSPWVKPN